jgi:hypothetical protein
MRLGESANLVLRQYLRGQVSHGDAIRRLVDVLATHRRQGRRESIAVGKVQGEHLSEEDLGRVEQLLADVTEALTREECQ